MICLRNVLDGACTMSIKSSTYISISHQVRCSIDGFCGNITPNVDKVCFSRGCSGRILTLFLVHLSEMSCTVSDDEQKYGGDLIYPILILLGANISVLLIFFLGGNLGRTYVKFHASSGATLSL